MLHHSAPSRERMPARSRARLSGLRLSAARRAATSPGSSHARARRARPLRRRQESRRHRGSGRRCRFPPRRAAKVSGKLRARRDPRSASTVRAPPRARTRRAAARSARPAPRFHAGSQSSPSIARLAGEHALQPVVPGIDEAARQAGADEIAACRQLAAEADGRACGSRRDAAAVTGSGIGSLAARRGANGFCTEPARSSNDACRSPRGRSA